MTPRVGIAASLDEGGLRSGRGTWYLDARYGAAVHESGGLPLVLPTALGVEPTRVLDGLDALLIPGGDDFPPPDGLASSAQFCIAPASQRAFDAALLDAALARGLPVLGICYGMQLLALRLGGELIHDIATQCASAQPHRLADGDTHALSIVPGSRLAGLLGSALAVNSRHHQAVSVPGPRLIVSARADDGLIEGVELPEPAGFAVGVQWHPETMPRGHRRALFGALVAAASGRQAPRETLNTSVS